MTTLLQILRAIVTYRTILFPATTVFAGVLFHAFGWKVADDSIRTDFDAFFGFLAAVVMVWGAVLDANNTKVKQALTQQADAINHNADLQDPRTDTNPLVIPPAYVPSPPKPPVAPATEKP